jgi:hypothetical protein
MSALWISLCPAFLPVADGKLWVMTARSRFRIGRWMLLAEGIAMGVFAGAGLAWSMANPQFGADGAPILWLRVTPIHCALMLGVGMLTIFASLGRTAPVFSRIASIGWLGLTIVCTWAAADRRPGPLGFDSRDSLLYGGLALFNLALVLWFTIGAHRAKEPDETSPQMPITPPGKPGHPPGRASQKRPDAVTTR